MADKKANKKSHPVRLSAVLWAQVYDLIGDFGESRNEVLGYILTEWFSEKQEKIAAQKRKVEELKAKISAIQEQADKEARPKREE